MKTKYWEKSKLILLNLIALVAMGIGFLTENQLIKDPDFLLMAGSVLTVCNILLRRFGTDTKIVSRKEERFTIKGLALAACLSCMIVPSLARAQDPITYYDFGSRKTVQAFLMPTTNRVDDLFGVRWLDLEFRPLVGLQDDRELAFGITTMVPIFPISKQYSAVLGVNWRYDSRGVDAAGIVLGIRLNP
jgi:hypothetical protein